MTVFSSGSKREAQTFVFGDYDHEPLETLEIFCAQFYETGSIQIEDAAGLPSELNFDLIREVKTIPMLKHLIEKRLPLFVEFFSAFMRYSSYVREVFLALLLILLLGAVLIWRLESLSFGNAVYFTMITGLTIGYGDITPQTPLGKLVSVAIGLVGMVFVGLIIAIATRALNETAHRHFDLEGEDQQAEQK